MITPFRLFEIILYAIINFLPYLILALYPFWNYRRFSKPVTVLLIVLLTLLQLGLTLMNTFQLGPSASVLSLISTGSYALFYFLAIREKPGKLFFVLLMVSNVANFVVVAGKCLEGFLFPENAMQQNCWSFSLTSVLVLLFVLPTMALFFKYFLKDAVTLHTQERIWHYLWLIPAVFYLFWYYNLYFTPLTSLEWALKPMNTLFTLLINLGSVLFYYIIVRLIQQSQNNLQLVELNHQLNLQTIQYENLQERMEETRRIRHDLRQHMNTLYLLAEEDRYDELQKYLQNYQKFSPLEQPLVFCENLPLNALLSHYAGIFQSKQIPYEYHITIPAKLSVSEADITVLLGNLLENAMDGCLTLPEAERKITLTIAMPKQNAMVITIDNPYQGELHQEQGQFLSTKHSGYGIGTESIRYIVKQYNGTVDFKTTGQHFHVSCVLHV